jgi:hypothetical protein
MKHQDAKIRVTHPRKVKELRIDGIWEMGGAST